MDNVQKHEGNIFKLRRSYFKMLLNISPGINKHTVKSIRKNPVLNRINESQESFESMVLAEAERNTKEKY